MSVSAPVILPARVSPGFLAATELASRPIPVDGLSKAGGATSGGGVGACCRCDGVCTETTEVSCTGTGGVYQGDGTSCATVGQCTPHYCATATAVSCNGVFGIDVSTPPCLGDADCIPFTPEGLVPTCDLANGKCVTPPDPDFTCDNPGPHTGCTYLRLTATDTSMMISTCDSGGSATDSIIELYEFDSMLPCCQTLLPVPNACSDDDCGPSTFLSYFCAEGLTIGREYLVQLCAWEEAATGPYSVNIVCPCAGACCDDATTTCTDGVDIDNCPPDDRFDLLAWLGDPSGSGTCAGMNPVCGGIGACCLPAGGCVDGNEMSCVVGNYFPGATCGQFFCPVPDSCIWDNGLNPFTVGFSSQYAPGEFFIEVADDFFLKGDSPSEPNPCTIDAVTWRALHFNHSAPCVPGGGPVGCLDNPFDYAGIRMTIYNDTGLPPGAGKGPTGQPSYDGVNPPMPPFHVGVFKYELFIPGPPMVAPPPGGGSWFEFIVSPDGTFVITLHLDPPLLLEKNKKNWIALAPEVPFTGFYQTAWLMSANSNGNQAQQFFPPFVGPGFVPIDFGGPPDLVDMAFVLSGFKCDPMQPNEVPGVNCNDLLDNDCDDLTDCDDPDCVSDPMCPCACDGDIDPPPNGNGVVDVDDLIAVLICIDEPPMGDCAASDINCDGAITFGDFDVIVCLFAGGAECCGPLITGACCVGAPVFCRQVTVQSCSFLGGTYQGDGTACGPGGPCLLCPNGTCEPNEGPCTCPMDCGPVPANEIPNMTCQDGMDNDCDMMTDCADPDCASDPSCNPCACDGDLDDTGFVEFKDLLAILDCICGGPVLPECDVNCDGEITLRDLGAAFCEFGLIPPAECCLSPAGACTGLPVLGNCLEMTPTSCLMAGGVYMGDGTMCPDPCPPCACSADISPPGGNGVVNNFDVLAVIACLNGTSNDPACDINCDGTVDDADLGIAFCQREGGGPECCDAVVGACCLNPPELGNSCLLVSFDTCTSLNGNWRGNGTNCDSARSSNPPPGASRGTPSACAFCGSGVCDPPDEDPCTCPEDCGAPAVFEIPGTGGTCLDGVDNDCDGFIDCADSDCTGATGCPCTSDVDCVLSDEDACTCDVCNSQGICESQPGQYGNVDCTGCVDVDDISCALDCFADFNSCPNADIAPPCLGDDHCDVDDISRVLDAFAGIDPCGCPGCQAACCRPGMCVDLTVGDCNTLGGCTHLFADCDDPSFDECELQACCFLNGTCQNHVPGDCVLNGGNPLGSGSCCANDYQSCP